MALIHSFRNSIEGPPGTVITPATSADGGDAFEHVSGGVTFSSDYAAPNSTTSARFPPTVGGTAGFVYPRSEYFRMRLYTYIVDSDAAFFRLLNMPSSSPIVVTQTESSGIIRAGTSGSGWYNIGMADDYSDKWIRWEYIINLPQNEFRIAAYEGDSLVPVHDSGLSDSFLAYSHSDSVDFKFGKGVTRPNEIYIDNVALDVFDARQTELIGPFVPPPTKLATPNVVLGETKKPSALGTSDGEATVSWSPVPNAVGYTAHLANGTTPDQNEFVMVGASVTSPYTFTGLSVGEYSFGIRAEV